MKLSAILFATTAAVAAAQEGNLYTQACDSKAVGDSCSYTVPSGATRDGVCFAPADSSACGPDYVDSSTKCVMCGEDNSTGAGGGDATPTKSTSVAACDNKSEGDDCGFVGGDGSKVTGSCQDQGAGACGPDFDVDTSGTCYICAASNDDSSPVGGGSPDGSSTLNECSGKSVGDSCTITRSGQDDIVGVCEDTEEGLETNDGKMACSPVGDPKVTEDPDFINHTDAPISSVLSDACTSKSSGASCSYVDAASGNKVTGTCADNGQGGLECDNEDAGSDDSDPLVAECASKSSGDSCELDFGVTTITGSCQADEAGDVLFCAPDLTNM